MCKALSTMLSNYSAKQLKKRLAVCIIKNILMTSISVSTTYSFHTVFIIHLFKYKDDFLKNYLRERECSSGGGVCAEGERESSAPTKPGARSQDPEIIT